MNTILFIFLLIPTFILLGCAWMAVTFVYTNIDQPVYRNHLWLLRVRASMFMLLGLVGILPFALAFKLYML